jgi:hypothetical protein
MKVISYALFGDPKSFEFNWYLRGIYFNFRMARLLYPEWTVWWHVEHDIYADLLPLLEHEIFESVHATVRDPAPKCESMMWRLRPLYYNTMDVTHVLSRDADAILTYKEAQAVQEWIDSGLGFHGITDDPAHSIPMMGGMTGFRVDHFKSTFPEYNTFEKLVEGADLKNHGTDQNLLMSRIFPKAKDNMMGHFFKGCQDKVKVVTRHVSNQIPGVDPRLWESNNTCRMIGSPGVVDFELLRFFKRFDNDPKFDRFEKQFPDLFYWQR